MRLFLWPEPHSLARKEAIMTDDQNLGETTVAEAPASSDPTPESQEPVTDQSQTQKPESPESDTGKNEVGEVPKDNAAWAAMRAENKRLKDAVSSVDPAYLESLRGATSPQTYTPQPVPQVTGDADYTQVTQSVNYANSQAARANQELSRLRNQMELQQDREAERAYPQLKTDKVFQQIVSEKKLTARVLGHDRTTLEIADEVDRLFNKRDEQVVAQTAETTKKQMLERQVISSEPRGTTSGGESSTKSEERRMKVRKGDMDAQTEVAKDLIANLEF